MATNGQSVLITHEVSNLGTLNINLHGVAALFYKQLNKDGLIKYLKSLDHLGYISKSHPGNHHKRWDYICLQLFLVQKLKHSKFNTGLTSSTEIDGIQISNQEVLQVFILLSNIGHLEGTIAAETAFFEYLSKDESAKSEFLSRISANPSFSKISDSIFSTRECYKIKYLIALNYVLRNVTDSKVLSAIKVIPERYLVSDDVQKLQIIYYKIRRLCFVYLDSQHCHTPIQLNISKVLINIYGYDSIFDPIERDHNNLLDSCETVLTKEIYISPISTLAYFKNHERFFDYLKRYKIGGKKIDYSNFLLSVTSGRREKFGVEFPDTDNLQSFQFYLEKASLKILDISFNSDFNKIVLNLYRLEESLKDLRKKKSKIKLSVQHDMRSTLLFFTFIIKRGLTIDQLKSVLRKFTISFDSITQNLNVELEYLPKEIRVQIREEMNRNFKNDLIRRYILYVLKLLLEKENRLNLYVKFHFRQIQERLNKGKAVNRILEANYAPDLAALNISIELLLSENIPPDIKNNLGIIREIATKTKDSRFYYSIFPIEIEERYFDAADLDKSGNSEARKILTDVDAVLIAIGEKIDIYLIEGKKLDSGHRSESRKDLMILKNMAKDQKIFKDLVITNKSSAKGGYLKVTV